MALYDNLKNLIAGATLFADTPLGVTSPFGGDVVPEGWILCQGQAISRTTYSDLFAVIGTKFGSGDGSTTFNLPDFQGSEPIIGINYIIKAKQVGIPQDWHEQLETLIDSKNLFTWGSET